MSSNPSTRDPHTGEQNYSSIVKHEPVFGVDEQNYSSFVKQEPVFEVDRTLEFRQGSSVRTEKEKRIPMTSAERAKRYRQRMRELRNASLQETAREEKRTLSPAERARNYRQRKKFQQYASLQENSAVSIEIGTGPQLVAKSTPTIAIANEVSVDHSRSEPAVLKQAVWPQHLHFCDSFLASWSSSVVGTG